MVLIEPERRTPRAGLQFIATQVVPLTADGEQQVPLHAARPCRPAV